MKKLILGLIVMAFSASNAPAALAASAVPKNLCFQWSAVSSSIGIKPGMSLKTAGGAVKQYVIQGHNSGSIAAPVSGSGYVVPATTTFHFTYAGSFRFGGATWSSFHEVFHNLSTNQGTIYWHYESENGAKDVGSSNFTAGVCNSFPLIAIASGEASGLPTGQ